MSEKPPPYPTEGQMYPPGPGGAAPYPPGQATVPYPSQPYPGGQVQTTQGTTSTVVVTGAPAVILTGNCPSCRVRIYLCLVFDLLLPNVF